MKHVFSSSIMKELDKFTIENLTPSITLMQRAAQAIAEYVPKGDIAVFCGCGNNGGDGYALAPILAERGCRVTVYAVTEAKTDEAKYYRDICYSCGIPILPVTDYQKSDCIVDCIFGIGFHGVPTGLEARAIEIINKSTAFTVSADIPSGLDADSGMGKFCVRADITVAISNLKPGHLLNDGKDKCGRTFTADIGIVQNADGYLLPSLSDLADAFPKRPHNSHKGTWGTAAVMGGSVSYCGAIKLSSAAMAAMRSGAGISRVIVPKGLLYTVLPSLGVCTAYGVKGDERIDFCPESIDGALSGITSLAVGMGMGRYEDAVRVISYIIKKADFPVIIDADGLFALKDADIDARSCPLIITPHVLEFSRLSGYSVEEILLDPIKKASEYAKRHGIIVLLKGPCTIVTDGNTVYLCDKGCPGMATAGSGDVLSGIIAGIIAQNSRDLLKETTAGAFIAALAGMEAEKKYGPVSQIASDTVEFIPEIIKQILI